jgi:hypothetical protein
MALEEPSNMSEDGVHTFTKGEKRNYDTKVSLQF